MLVLPVLMAILGLISEAAGVNPFIIIGIVAALFLGLVIVFLKMAGESDSVPSERRCNFVRANGTQWVRDCGDVAYYCEYHAAQSSTLESVPDVIEKPRRTQCGFVRSDGTRCRKLKPIQQSRCEIHSIMDEA